MQVTLAQRAAPLLITAMLVAAPVWAQTAGSQTAPGGMNAPSGTSQKAAPRSSHAAMAGQPGETMQSLVERRITDLHGKLHITPQQSQQWDPLAQVMRDNAREMDQVYKQRAEKLGAMSAVDNMQSYAQIEQQRAQDVQKLVPALQALYTSLSDQQKKTADEIFRNYAASVHKRHQAAER